MDGISALMDGELDERQAQSEIRRLKDDAELRGRWEGFHLIGDALRGERLLSQGFSAAFSKRLAEEPTVLAPRRSAAQGKRLTTYALSAAASLFAVAFVAWVALSPTGPGVAPGITPAKDLVAQSAGVPASLPIVNVSSGGHMNEYLLAHQGFSPSTAIQGLAPYIRSVSATRAPEGR